MLTYLYQLNKNLARIAYWKKPSTKQQEIFIKKFKYPSNDIERSYFQYMCQRYVNNETIFIVFIKNIISLILFGYYWIKIKPYNMHLQKRSDAVLVGVDKSLMEALPSSVIDRYGNVSFKYLNTEMSLDNFSKSFIIQIIKRYPFSWAFILKNMIKIANYNYAVSKYSPDAIVSSCEYSFTSSILTNYCNALGIKHINIMHGEKWFSITDAFVHFTVFYVWDCYYVQLFARLQGFADNFIVELPQTIKNTIQNKHEHHVVQSTDFKFFLGFESLDTLSKLAKIVEALSLSGYKLAIRLHPRFTDKSLVFKIFNAEQIELPHLVDIYDSILSTKYAVAVGSTVLFQAYLLGVAIVIDDVSNPKRYQELLDADYILLHKPHKLLSSFCGTLE